MIDIAIATEDFLSEAVIIKIIRSIDKFNISLSLGREGCGYLTKKINNFNKMAERQKVLVVLDLDNNNSPDEYIRDITRNENVIHENLLFSIPVKEIESWILADKQGISSFLDIPEARIDRNPDELMDPKEKIISLARTCRNRVAKDGIPPKPRAISKVGLSYNTLLIDFVNNHWSIERAAVNSPSLNRTLILLDNAN